MTIIPVFFSILTGIVVGYLLRQKKIVNKTGILLNMVIMLLLLFLGIAVGSNREVVTRFASLGLEALLLTLGGTLGSLIAALWLYRKVLHGPKGASHQSEKYNQKKR